MSKISNLFVLSLSLVIFSVELHGDSIGLNYRSMDGDYHLGLFYQNDKFQPLSVWGDAGIASSGMDGSAGIRLSTPNIKNLKFFIDAGYNVRFGAEMQISSGEDSGQYETQFNEFALMAIGMRMRFSKLVNFDIGIGFSKHLSGDDPTPISGNNTESLHQKAAKINDSDTYLYYGLACEF